MLHGYLSARVKGHAQTRQRLMARAIERTIVPTPSLSGKADVEGWKRLATLFGDQVIRGGERLVS